MEDNRIPNQIDHIAERRFLGCLGRSVLVFLLSMVALAVFIRLVNHRNLVAAATSVFAGFVFGYATSFLAPQARRVLRGTFLVIPILAIVAVIAAQLFISSPKVPRLRVAIIPIFLSVGFVLGQRRRGA